MGLFPWCLVVFGVLPVYVSHVAITAPGEQSHCTNCVFPQGEQLRRAVWCAGSTKNLLMGCLSALPIPHGAVVWGFGYSLHQGSF